MLGTAAASAIAVFAQSLTSLYPILIKRINTNILTHTTVRFTLFPVLALVLGIASGGFGAIGDVMNSWGKIAAILGIGALNLTHVFSSYIAFDELQAGIAMSIFYTYPFWNLLGARLFFGEYLQLWTIPLFLIALAGTYLVASAAPEARAFKHEADSARSPMRGIIAALIAALTETGLYLAVRGSISNNPFANMIMLYLGGAALLIPALPLVKQFSQQLIDFRPEPLMQSIAFNTFIGFVGTTLMFMTARMLPVYMYSILAFVGVATAYMWGIVFAKEKPNKKAVSGAGVVLGAIGLLYYKS
jgi:drug/metabolite transporter (DMT)-like permease